MAERTVRLLPLLLASLVLLAGCGTETAGHATAAVDITVAGFESFAGMTLPADAEDVDLTASIDGLGEPVYLIGFDLPTDEIDPLCRAGQLSRPLHIVTIHDKLRRTFGYEGDATPGVRWSAGSLPSNVRIQRELFAVGTSGETAHVQIQAYRMGR